MKNLVCILTILFFISGCVSDEANRCYFSNLPPKNASEVEVLKDEPNQAYIVIADFQAVNASVDHMRKRAARVGADAVIVVPLGGWYSSSEIWVSKDRHSNSYSRLTATAIKYKN